MLATRFRDLFNRQDYGLWALEIPEIASFIGFVGLHHNNFEAPFTPASRSAGGLPARWGKATPPKRRGPAPLRLRPAGTRRNRVVHRAG